MTKAPRFLGAVLAGGDSTRFGRAKGPAVVGGVTLVDRAARTLSAVFPEVVVVSSIDGGYDWPTIPDLRVRCGPLGGIEAALHAAAERQLDGVFVLACDLPIVSAADVKFVLGAIGVADAAAPARAGVPAIEPLCAAYRLACQDAVGAILDSGRRAAHLLFDSVDGTTVVLREDAFLNVNTTKDGDRAEAELERRGA